MKTQLLLGVACLTLLAGCKDANTEAELAAARARLAVSEQAAVDATVNAETALREAAALRRQLGELKDKLEAAQKPAPEADKPAPAAPDPQVAGLKATIAELEKKIADLEAARAAQPAAQPAPQADTPPRPDAATVEDSNKRIEALLPLVKSDAATGKQRDELLELLFKSDKETRDRVITQMQQWVKDEPGNKHARLALANALISRFGDIKRDDFMGQATLAGQITEEATKALELDPDFYEAVHFLALMKVEYPAFTPEFKAADKDLKRALDLQAKLTWEERFADIYVGYSQWYRKQNKLDEAAAKCQAGLDKSPRNEALLAEQKKVEDARKPAGE